MTSDGRDGSKGNDRPSQEMCEFVARQFNEAMAASFAKADADDVRPAQLMDAISLAFAWVINRASETLAKDDRAVPTVTRTTLRMIDLHLRMTLDKSAGDVENVEEWFKADIENTVQSAMKAGVDHTSIMRIMMAAMLLQPEGDRGMAS